jgi:nitrite reductase/ring-hydroxylating ferredoxin subunit
MPMPSPLRGPYAAYKRQASNGEDAELTHVERGSPCGEYLRRFWQPVALSADLKDLPVRLRIMGEDLVLFRDLRGRTGLLELHCCHRRSSLEFGKICESGIRCAYHGWQYDVDGRILDTPGEPVRSKIKENVFQGAYPTREFEGIVFAYMGPPDRMPEFPLYDLYEKPGTRLVPVKVHSPCNWLQVRENEMDPIHITFLHTRTFGTQFAEVFRPVPTLEFIETPVGMMYITTRRWKDGKVYIRSNDMVLPNLARVAGIEDAEGDKEILFDRRNGGTNWNVPIDNESCWTIGWDDEEKLVGVPGLDAYIDRSVRENARPTGAFDVGQTGEPSYEQRQRAPGDWDVWVSQGRITRHDQENLAHSDGGVAMYRKLVRRGIRAVAEGRDPKGWAGTNGQVRRTYSHNSVVFLPEEADPETDARQRAEMARKLTDRILQGEIRPYVEQRTSDARPKLDA